MNVCICASSEPGNLTCPWRFALAYFKGLQLGAYTGSGFEARMRGTQKCLNSPAFIHFMHAYADASTHTSPPFIHFFISDQTKPEMKLIMRPEKQMVTSETLMNEV